MSDDDASYSYPVKPVPLFGWPRVHAQVAGHGYVLQALVSDDACCDEHPAVGIQPESVLAESMITEDIAVALTRLYQARVPSGFYDGIIFQHIY